MGFFCLGCLIFPVKKNKYMEFSFRKNNGELCGPAAHITGPATSNIIHTHDLQTMD